MYFVRGQLPWQGLKAAPRKRKYDRIVEKKMTTPSDILSRRFPSEFGLFLNYCHTLRFDDKPDYAYLRKLLRRSLLSRRVPVRLRDFSIDATWSSRVARSTHTSLSAPRRHASFKAPFLFRTFIISQTKGIRHRQLASHSFHSSAILQLCQVTRV
jgi:hypothetical protein